MVALPILTRISLAPGVARIDIQTEVDNTARDHRLRVHFPAPFAVPEADHDGHFEVVRRPIGVPESTEKWVEQPRPETHQGAFTDISNGRIGLTIANHGLPEVEALNNGEHTEIALTLLRAVGWLSRDDMPVRQGHAGPALETPGAQVPGKWGFTYAIIPHQGDWRESYRQAFAFQTDLRAVETGLHAGEIPVQGAFISSSPGAFEISAVKAAENGDGWLVRGYNISSETIKMQLKPLRRFTQAALVNLAEQTISSLSPVDDGCIAFSVTGHQVAGVRLSD